MSVSHAMTLPGWSWIGGMNVQSSHPRVQLCMQSGWCYRLKQHFTFRYDALEDES